MTDAARPRTGLSVRQYEKGDRRAIDRFNARLRAGGSPHVLYEEPDGADATSLPRERLFVVVDGEEIRGGAFLRETSFAVGAEALTVGFVKYPVAESLIDKAFAGVPAALLVHLMRVQPNLAALGMGGHAGPFAQLLARLRWPGSIVTTWIAPLSPHRAAGRLPQLRRDPLRRTVANVARYTGVAAIAGLLYRAVLRFRLHGALRGTSTSEVQEFDARDDQLWEQCRGLYAAMTARDAHALRWRYGASSPPLVRLRVERDGAPIGWVVLQIIDPASLPADPPFGALRLGIVCDALARPEHVHTVVAAAMKVLLDRHVDLALTNHSHPEWQHALRRFGFVRGPENFAFYRAPALERALTSHQVPADDVFISRGDDGLFAQ